MSKIRNAILMLDYLNTGKQSRVKDLAEKLGVSERMVKYYKQCLEEAGIFIDSSPGNGGGYTISKINNIGSAINKYDIELLERIYSETKNNFEYADKLKNFLDKIKHLYRLELEKNKFEIVTEENKQNDKLIEIIENAIKTKRKITIVYSNLKNDNYERTIHPLYLFSFKDTLYVTAFCELRGDIRHFELKRIKKIINST